MFAKQLQTKTVSKVEVNCEYIKKNRCTNHVILHTNTYTGKLNVTTDQQCDFALISMTLTVAYHLICNIIIQRNEADD